MQLGEPLGIITLDKTRSVYRYVKVSEGASVVEFRLEGKREKELSLELRFLPDNKHAERILVFLEGTVHGYFYFDENGRLKDKVVTIS